MRKHDPQRMCIGCQQMYSKNDLLRVVRLVDGRFCTVVSGMKNGRGAYLCKKRCCLETAIKRRGLERSFKAGLSKEAADALKKEMEALAEQ